MGPVQRFRDALQEVHVDEKIVAQIMEGYETITDNVKKETRAAFFKKAIQRMDALLDPETSHAVRDPCACSKGGWRLKAVQKVAADYAGKSLQEKLEVLGQVRYMGKPYLNADGSITGGIGDQGGFECPCPVFSSTNVNEPVSFTYCYCCAGHLRHHYQIALGLKLKTRTVVSSILESQREKPCRFIFDIVD